MSTLFLTEYVEHYTDQKTVPVQDLIAVAQLKSTWSTLFVWQGLGHKNEHFIMAKKLVKLEHIIRNNGLHFYDMCRHSPSSQISTIFPSVWRMIVSTAGLLILGWTLFLMMHCGILWVHFIGFNVSHCAYRVWSTVKGVGTDFRRSRHLPKVHCLDSSEESLQGRGHMTETAKVVNRFLLV